ncbi:serine hydrolase domain-containing protein [Parasphingorhabdus sp.]|uniref:serine hydrolase domain-containing protein n=1 Tax=Parasphingorhabdus sp. TaxID=2709688 RepID=UPI0032EB929D
MEFGFRWIAAIFIWVPAKMRMRPPVAMAACIALLHAGPMLAAPAETPKPIELGLVRTIKVPGAPARFTLKDRLAHYRVPGISVAVIENCRIVDARGFGITGVNGLPVGPDTLFQAGSISKTVTAVGALKLVDQGKLGLDTDVRVQLHNWNASNGARPSESPVTLRGLLGHTAGTGVAGMNGYSPGAPLPNLEQILNGLPPANTDAIRIEAAPGTKWKYSGGGYVVAQALMVGKSKQTFPQLMKRLVLDPAGMTNSSFQQPMDSARMAHAAAGVGPDGAPQPGNWLIYPEMAAAGLWTTPGDLAVFAVALARAVRGEDFSLLSREAASQMMTRGPGNWGLGVDLGKPDQPRQFSHTGHTTGYQSMLIMYPDTCQGAAVMTNADEGAWLVQEVMRSIAQAYAWPGQKPRAVQRAIPLTEDVSRRFVGKYRLKDFPSERFTISRKPDGGLYWARDGHIGRDLLPATDTRLFSPDSEMSLSVASASAQATTLQLSFGGGNNVAERIE